jgi:uncharacterized membrane protein
MTPSLAEPRQPAPAPSSPLTGPGSPRALAWLLSVASAIGLAAAFVLTVEKIALLKDSNYVPSCSINPILSCGSVMTKPQAEVFGFPNSLLGIAGFSVLLTIAMALLAGATFTRWFWLGLQVGVTAGVLFVHWLIIQSLYRIEALCPYCMVVWVVTIAVFVATTLHVTAESLLPLPARARELAGRLGEYRAVILTAWYLAITALITEQFWTYWQTLLP